MNDLVKVREYLDRASADIGRSMLEAHGIPAVIQADDSGGTRPDVLVVGRVRLLVGRQDLVEAEELLADVEVFSDTTDEEDRPDESAKLAMLIQGHVRRSFVAALVGLIILPPVLTHIFALWHLAPVLKHWSVFTKGQKARATTTIAISIAVMLAAGYFLIVK